MLNQKTLMNHVLIKTAPQKIPTLLKRSPCDNDGGELVVKQEAYLAAMNNMLQRENSALEVDTLVIKIQKSKSIRRDEKILRI